MKHLKLFEEIKIDQREFPFDGHDISPRERKILSDLFGGHLLLFTIKIEDHYYYTRHRILSMPCFNVFDSFDELKSYIFCWYYDLTNSPKKLLEHLKTTELDPSFDNNYFIRFAHNDKHKEIVELLLNDKRVRDKLTEEEIKKYNKIIA